MSQNEVIIWRGGMSSLRASAIKAVLLALGVLALLSSITTLFVAGIVIAVLSIALGLALPKLAQEYVITNMRAIIKKGGKIVKEVPLNTPNLVVSAVNETTYSRVSAFSLTATVITFVDVIFVVNGVELMRFKRLKSGQASELLTKLASMGIPTG